jgi:hypothetical protein
MEMFFERDRDVLEEKEDTYMQDRRLNMQRRWREM